MAFAGIIRSIDPLGSQFRVSISYSDSATGYQVTKVYLLDNIDKDSIVTLTQTDGLVFKNDLARNNALLARVGTVIPI